mmetsp:Transcript_9082/g.15558  ORF Transcript_9082/g.15558 Transcript_9082/m.15558 type:complete len:90 (-) Transcript_9082:56-325(-)
MRLLCVLKGIADVITEAGCMVAVATGSFVCLMVKKFEATDWARDRHQKIRKPFPNAGTLSLNEVKLRQHCLHVLIGHVAIWNMGQDDLR